MPSSLTVYVCVCDRERAQLFPLMESPYTLLTAIPAYVVDYREQRGANEKIKFNISPFC